MIEKGTFASIRRSMDYWIDGSPTNEFLLNDCSLHAPLWMHNAHVGLKLVIRSRYLQLGGDWRFATIVILGFYGTFPARLTSHFGGMVCK